MGRVRFARGFLAGQHRCLHRDTPSRGRVEDSADVLSITAHVRREDGRRGKRLTMECHRRGLMDVEAADGRACRARPAAVSFLWAVSGEVR